MATTVLLVRHGQTNSNITGYYMGNSDEGLDETGYAQAHSLSSRLAKLPIVSVYSSPLRRAYNTALIIAKPHHLDVTISDDLIEIQLGDWGGLHTDEIRRRWPDLWQQLRTNPSELTFPNGESFKQLTERSVRVFDQVASANQGKPAVMVTHDAIIRALAAYALGVPNSIYRRVKIENASLSVIQVNDGKLRLVTLNDTAHFEA